MEPTDRELWDREAAALDDEPDHGLGDPVVRAAWRTLLLGNMPVAPARVTDLGCGTGTLTRLLVDDGYSVDGLDFSEEMIRRARSKVPEATFIVGDAADPPLERRAYDVALCRHVLWAMPDPTAAFSRWLDLLTPGGRVVLVEGRWGTGAGLTAAEVTAIAEPHCSAMSVRRLPDAQFWDKPVTDERYLVVARP